MVKSLYKIEIQIPFHQVDPAGILFFGHVFTIAHQAFETFITETLNIQWQEWFQNPEWCVPLKHVSADYLRPIVGGDRYIVSIAVEEVKETSFILKTIISKDDIDHCHVKSVHLFVDKTILQKIPIPKLYKDLLCRARL